MILAEKKLQKILSLHLPLKITEFRSPSTFIYLSTVQFDFRGPSTFNFATSGWAINEVPFPLQPIITDNVTFSYSNVVKA